MSDEIGRIDAPTLKARLNDGGEIALLDPREEVPFDRRHLLMACCVPLGRLESLADALVPRRAARVVWCDDGDGAAMLAARRMAALGYRDVTVLDGGVAAWETAGYPVYSGVHVPSKAFAEVVEDEVGTPWISVRDLKAMIDGGDDIAIYDSRSYEEYHKNSIPGAINVPGAELVYRFADLTPSPDTTVIINCGGRTRSIIGAQALINAGFPNKIVSLKNGTQDWHLAGYDVVRGATRRPPAVSDAGLEASAAAAARVAERFGVVAIDEATLESWRAEATRRALYVLDVRTPEEYEAGHLPDARSAPGGQLVQETDTYLGVWGGRVALVDDNGVRATMTASWLIQMGWTDVAVLSIDPNRGDLATGPWAPRVLGLDGVSVAGIGVTELRDRLAAGAAHVVDLAYSAEYAEGHIPGAWFAMRTRLADALTGLPGSDAVVLTSPDGALARLAAADMDGVTPVMALEGGTNAWIEAGYALEKGKTRMAVEADDVRLMARDQGKNVEQAMREYLAWEIDLVNQMAVDGDHRFRVVTAGTTKSI